MHEERDHPMHCFAILKLSGVLFGSVMVPLKYWLQVHKWMLSILGQVGEAADSGKPSIVALACTCMAHVKCQSCQSHREKQLQCYRIYKCTLANFES